MTELENTHTEHCSCWRRILCGHVHRQ